MTTAPDARIDLGMIDEPLFVFGGPYSNLAATRRVLEIAEERGFPPDRIVCTGDVVAYCAHPAETANLIQDSGIHVVMGNCEESLGRQADNCGCGFEDGSACDVLSRQWFAYAMARINADTRAWMRQLPRHIHATIGGRRTLFVHGDPADISGWAFASSPTCEIAAHFDATKTDIIVGGHCGLPFIRTLQDDRVWFNPGVVGMPANDGTPRGWYGTIEPKRAFINLAIEPFDYAYHIEAEAMREAGLVSAYAEALASGLWPNMDILPAVESAQCGQPLPVQRHSLARTTGHAA